MTEHSHKGLQSQRERHRIDALVRAGKASPWVPYRNVNEALVKAGIT